MTERSADAIGALIALRKGSLVSPPPKGSLWGRIAYATVVTEAMSEADSALDAAEARCG